MPQPKPKKTPGPEPERLKIEGDPEQAFRQLLKPPKEGARKSGKKKRRKS